MSAPIAEAFQGITLVIVPIEESSSFVRGSADGPEELARELAGIEPYDPDLDRGLGERLPHEVVRLPEASCLMPHALEALEVLVGQSLDQGRFVVTLGGEHTITLGPLKAAITRFGDIGLVQIDAHGDLRQQYEGRLLSHACVMKRAIDLGLPLLGVGIRSKCIEEIDLVRSSPKITNFSPREIRRSWDEVIAAIEALPHRVYLTVDIDGFDPTVAPGVGTPESGGLTWRDVAKFIDELTKRRQIIGLDVVEMAPKVERDRTMRLAARTVIRVLLRSMGASSRPRSDDRFERSIPTGGT